MNNEDMSLYYHEFGYRGCHLSTLLGNTNIAEINLDVTDYLSKDKPIRYLLLGSATDRNLDYIALLGKKYRADQSSQDLVTMIDINFDSVKMHRDQSRSLDQRLEIYKARANQSADFTIPYQRFEFAQTDMRNLPFQDKSFDVIISHYTFNFLSEYTDIEKAFSEISRTLSDNGMFMFSVMMSKLKDEELGWIGGAKKFYTTGMLLFQLASSDYHFLANKYGLKMKSYCIVDEDLRCGIFTKAL